MAWFQVTLFATLCLGGFDGHGVVSGGGVQPECQSVQGGDVVVPGQLSTSSRWSNNIMLGSEPTSLL